MGSSADRFGRRTLLRGGRDLALLSLAPAPLVGALTAAAPAAAQAEDAGTGGYFLTAAELETLAAVCDRFIPGPPEDPDPGALDAGVPNYIDLFLGAFLVGGTPRIWAGGPFSDRAGATHDDFADFLELDEIEELAWRTRIEGSLGIPEREWGGPVEGLQQKYRKGLATLDDLARARGGRRFHQLPTWFQDVLIMFPQWGLGEFLDLVWQHSIEGMYGAPEYGGNRGLAGWAYTQWPGDSQPRGYTAAEVSEP
ncbi:MAG: gluconate 2-dehydrogenase subunit 3 family protein [Acidimicrobiia bacterium]|nr:gluconate 2-dehydrogenase subunit 3 family protein [Acidimicrobiia bacterium]